MKKINDKLKLNETTIARNRIVMPPMDTVAAEKDGKPHSFHIYNIMELELTEGLEQ
jgi:2,4-dienoyl-CoA reductase-like NADH-dependent reductase (Old Yellow Enzyme family)